ncbi:MAG: alpha-2-macroglobulin family protein [Terracidiphilus sp.]
MTRMIGYMVLFLHLAVGVMGQGQGGSNPRVTDSGMRVQEDKASARFEEDGLRVTLPFSAPAGSGVQVTAWLAAPNDARSGERSVAIRSGERAATLTLDWPSDAKGKRVDDVSWYRVVYHINADGTETAHGILSVGAIATNLMRLRVVYPKQIASREATSVRVIAANPVTGKLLGGVKLKATLADRYEAAKAKDETRLATTGTNGEAILTFAAMGDPGDSLDLTVEGTLSGGDKELTSDKLEVTLDLRDQESVHVEMDKPLHKPGETVHLRALVLMDKDRVAPNESVKLTINDPDNKKLIEESLKTNAFGIVAYDWKTSAQTAVGEYTATFDADKMTGDKSREEQTVRIQRYDLPEFHIIATPDQPYFLIGDPVSVKIHAEYLFGKPVAAGKVRVVRSENAHWNAKTGRMEEPDTVDAKAELDANGDATVTLDVKQDTEDFKKSDYQNYQDLNYRALVTDASTGKTEPVRFTVRLTKEPVHIFMNRLGGDGREGEYMIRTSYADGAPAKCAVTFDWIDTNERAARAASVTTNRFGLAKVLLHYPERTVQHDRNLRISASDAQGKTGHFDDTLWMNPNDQDSEWISLKRSLLRPGQAIEGTVHGKAVETVDLDVVSENAVLAHLSIPLASDESTFSIPASPEFRGFVTISVFSALSTIPYYHYSGWMPGSARTVFYPEDRGLKASVAGLETIYSPGAPVDASLDLAVGKKPVSGVFGVSVYDTAVEQRAQSETEDNDRGNWGTWFSPFDYDQQADTRASFDSTDILHPIADDLDLAAEASMENYDVNRIEMETEDYNEERGAYNTTITKNTKPLKDAILTAEPASLPATFDELKHFVATTKLGEEILLDPWGTPYRVETQTGWQDDVVNFVSAGPDKQFGTADDFTVNLVTRNVFEVPGKRLERLLKKTAEAGQPLPANVDELKKLARDAGLDLDEEAKRGLKMPNFGKGDPKPLSYLIHVLRQNYSVQVQNNAEMVIWQSGAIDYFHHTEQQLEASLTAWMNAGHAFPENEADARLAFKAAGIDFDALRNPLGKPFSLHTFREFSYARVDKVKAGATVTGDTEKVTVLGQVIQVLPADSTSIGGIRDEVARFTHSISQQSGSDLKALPVKSGLFKGNTGAIGGTVTDQTGAVIAGAKVTALNPETNGTWETQTKEAGTYILSELVPGLYNLRVDSKGFETFVLTAVHVSSAALTTVDVKLSLGAETQTVSVVADALAVQSDSNVVSTLISSEQISEISTENRNFAALAALSLGVSSGLPKSTIKGHTGSATITESVITPRLRHVFEETAYWTPSLETDAQGHAALKFTLPDSLTTWKLHAIGSTLDGRVTSLDRTFITFQPFFVDLDPPQVLTVGDEISLPVNLRNYTPRAVTLPVTVKAADWFTLSTPAVTQMTVPSGGSSALVVGLNAKARTDAGALNVSAANAHDGDAVEKKVKVHPDGEPRMVTVSELVRGGKNTVHFDLPPEAIPGSVHAEMLLYPNLGTNVYQAMKAVLERPYGCGEQTISSTYPSLLFLELAAAAKAESPAKAQAQDYLQLGYDRLMGYFNAAGGLTYWGHDSEEADVALTAYAIEFLTEAEPYVEVDRSRTTSAIEWLLNQQSADGSWKPHYGQPSALQVLFIASALETALEAKDFATQAKGDLPGRMKQAIAKAQAYAATSVASLHDPYANSLRLTLAAKVGDKTATARLRDELVGAADHGRDGAHWEFDGYSPFYGWGTGGRLEATAMALTALDAAANIDDTKLEDDALLYLLENRDGYGVWLSGQATVRVLKALLPVAVKQLQNPSPADFSLAVNGQPLSAAQAQSIKFDSRLIDAPRILDLTAMVHAGTNTLEFSGAGDAAIANAQITTWFYLPWGAAVLHTTSTTVPGKSSGLDFGYSCDAENARVGQPISCNVSARRVGSQGYGMMLAEVGLPPGADVDRAVLGKLLDKWTIDRYEIQPDRIVFYLWPSSAEGVKFSFNFTPRYAIRAKAAPAKLTDYYNPDLNAVLAPQSFVVSAAPN